MKKTMSLIAATLASIAVSGQEIYDNARLFATDLNGTARYVGMGGAMEALGSDISTMGTNPAGIALMRRSSASVSFGVNTLRGVQSIDDFNKTRMSFNQAGFVFGDFRVYARSDQLHRKKLVPLVDSFRYLTSLIGHVQTAVFVHNKKSALA